MASSAPAARITAINGQAFAKVGDGELRALQVGDLVFAADVLLSGPDSQIDLASADGRSVVVQADETLTVDAEVLGAVPPDASDSALQAATGDINKLIEAINQGGNLDELLEAPAAGDSGGGSDGGSTFVRVLRVAEDTGAQNFTFDSTQRAADTPIPENIPQPTTSGTGTGTGSGEAPPSAPPVAHADSVTTEEDTALTISAATLLGNDTGAAGSTLSIVSVQAATHGSVALVNGNPVFTPDADYNGPASFSYTLSDGQGGSSSATVAVNVTPVNDAAVIIPAVANLTETNAVLSTGGTLSITDIDSPATFVPQSNVAGSNGYGHFTLAANGAWTYTTDSAHNEFAAGTTYTDMLTVASADGTTSTISVNIVGTNDAAIIVPAVANLTETNAVLTTSGTLSISDIDSPATFVPQSNVAGSNGYGHFTLAANGAWTYTTDSAHNEFAAGATYTDTLTVASADGTTSTITVNILGTNDAAVIVPAVANLTETNSVLSASGTLSITDIDSPATFVPQSNVAGSGGYGHFTLASDGSWSYATDTAHNEFAAGTTYTDSLTVTSADGTTSTITVNILGTNDAAVIVPAVANLTESNAVLSTSGTLSITDVDSPATFVPQTNVAGSYGHFTLASNGAWTYTTDSAHNEFAAGTTYTDTLTVASADGTTSTISVNILGTNDAAVIVPAVANLTESNAVLSTSGTLSITDVDSPATFVPQTNVAGSYGHFTLASNGAWTYTTDSAHNEFAAGTTYTDTLTVASADGTTSTISVNILGTNDAAVIVPAVVTLNETDAILHTGGTLAITDVDSPATFVAQTNVPGSAGYGHFSLATNGVWTYTTDSAHNEFAAGTTYTDTLTVASADGTTSTISVNILGTNDAAVIIPAVANLIETDAPLTTGGTLSISDVDSPASFVAQTNVAGSGGYGHFTLAANGAWTYTADSAHNEFAAGTTYTDTLTVASADGTTSTISVNILGTNDAAVITPAVANLTETNAPLTTGGTLSISDVDSPASFVAQTNVAGSGGYGHFTLAANGAWTYTADSAHNEFAAGTTYTDTLTVASADGTTSTISVNILGTNDAAVITPAVANLTETNAVLSAIGLLSITDIDSPATFVPQTNVAGSNAYGHFSLAANGKWIYTTDTAHNEFVAGQTYTDSLTVTSADGTTSTISVNILGTNDAAVITPAVVTLNETDAILHTGGTLAITDVDSPATFVAQTNVPGSAGYGHFSLATNGVWTYTTDSAHNEFVAGQTYTDSLTVTSADGTTSTISVNILGTNDAAVITPAVVTLNETDAILHTGGTLAITDVDSPATFVAQTNVPGSAGYGHFSLATNGVWTYTTDSAHNEFAAGTTYTDSLTVTSADGTTSTITVNILGTNDAAVITPAVVTLNETDAILHTGGTLAITDVDSPATFVAQTNVPGSAGYGHFSLATNGVWTYTTDSAHNEFAAGTTYTDSLTVTSADGTTSKISVNILGTNDAPVAVADTAAVSEAGMNPPNIPFAGIPSVSGNVLSNDTDVDIGDTHSVTAVNGLAGNVGAVLTGVYGSLTIAADGAYTYTLNNADPDTQALAQGAAPTEVFSYTMRDAAGLTSSSTLTVTVNGSNDAPLAIDDIVITNIAPGQDVPIPASALLANDSDPDSGASLSLTSAYNAQNDSVSGTNPVVFRSNAAFGASAHIVNEAPLYPGDSETVPLNNTLATAYEIARSQFGQVSAADAPYVGDATLPSFKWTGSIIDAPNTPDVTDADFLKVYLYAGEKITLDIDGADSGKTDIGSDPKAVDMYLKFYDANGVELAENDDSPATLGGLGSVQSGYHSNSLDSYLQYTVAHDGYYYIDATAFNNSPNGISQDDGNYQLWISIQPSAATHPGAFDYNLSDGTLTDSGHVSVTTVLGSLISGGSADEILIGGSGNDSLSGGGGKDILLGGGGNDQLTGGAGADVFAWSLADHGDKGRPAIDTVTDFDAPSGSDKIDLRDLLQGESHSGTAVGNLDHYLHFEKSGNDTIVHVSSTGEFNGHDSSGRIGEHENLQIVVQAVDLTVAGNDQQIIHDLLTKGKLVTD